MNSHSILFSTLFFLTSCTQKPDIQTTTLEANAQQVNTIIPKDFVQYWYSGKAELNSYDLKQSRYGQIRNGEAVMVFVTEDFSKSKQVKLDFPEGAINDAVSVLKLNFMKKFKTGVYDYAVMQSVFTPVDLRSFPHTLKTTFSSQDWCGHVFSQLNLEKDGSYKMTDFSYFESEGDTEQKLKNSLLEEEIWNRIRINPESIPTGELNLIPTQSFARLQHKKIKPSAARVSLNKNAESSSEVVIEYLNIDRTVQITFENYFPFKILGWTEKNGNQPATTATLKKSMRSAYWNQNGNDSAFLRDSLELAF